MLAYAFHKGGNSVLALWQRQSPSGTIRYELDDEGYRVVLDESQSRFAWQGLRRLWCYSDVWIIEILKNQSTFFPPPILPTKLRGSSSARAAGQPA